MTTRAIWRYYFAFTVLVLGLLLTWAFWRDATCVPCSTTVRLDKPSTVNLSSHWFANQRYDASFIIEGITPPDFDWYDKADEHLWRGTLPEIQLRVLDGKGASLLIEESVLDRSHGWTVSGPAGSGPVAVYKPLAFHGTPFQSYSVNLAVIRASPAASRYRVSFQFRRLCEYEALGTCFVVLVVGVSIAILAVVPLLLAKVKAGGQTLN